VASEFGNYKKMFLIVQTYLEGQSLCSPHLTPQIQSLPEVETQRFHKGSGIWRPNSGQGCHYWQQGLVAGQNWHKQIAPLSEAPPKWSVEIIFGDDRLDEKLRFPAIFFFLGRVFFNGPPTDSHLKLLPTSILDTYKVIEHINMLPMAIQYQPYTVIPTLLGSDFGARLGHLWIQNDEIMSWSRLTATSNCFPHPY
jgi:hypothetical protein